MALRHDARTVETMKPTLAVTALIIVTLSGCALQVRDPAGSTGNPPTAAASPSPRATSSVSSAQPSDTPGGFTDDVCSGQDFTIDRAASVLVLKGACGRITVTASDVFLTVDSLTDLIVQGDRATVVVNGEAAAVSLAGSTGFVTVGSASSVSVAGSGNTVTATTAGSIDVSGSNNYVTWTAGASGATDGGSGNTLVGP